VEIQERLEVVWKTCFLTTLKKPVILGGTWEQTKSKTKNCNAEQTHPVEHSGHMEVQEVAYALVFTTHHDQVILFDPDII